MEQDPRIRRLLAQLDQARVLNLRVFGADQHRYGLGPPLADAALAEAEAARGVRLPEEFRRFLTQAGNGGAGPYYGVYGLRCDAAGIPELPAALATPCPLHPGMATAGDWVAALGVADEGEAYRGTLPLGTRGCNYDVALVVTGPARGRVVYLAVQEGPPYFVPDADFLAWYGRWLDELLAGYDMTNFGFGPIGTEADFLAAFADGQRPVAERCGGLAALFRLPKLSPPTTDCLVAALEEGEADFRARAARLLGHFRYHPAGPELARLLADPTPAVRCAALAALADLGLEPWEAEVRARLRDPEKGVAAEALRVLRQARRLTAADLVPLLQSPDRGTRQTAAYDLAQGAAQAAAPLLPVLDDPDQQVRLYVAQALGRLKDPAATPALAGRLAREPEWGVANNVVLALGKIGDPRAVPALLAMTRHAEVMVRLNAIRILGDLGDPQAIPTLEGLLADPTEGGALFGDRIRPCRVGDLAAEALARLR